MDIHSKCDIQRKTTICPCHTTNSKLIIQKRGYMTNIGFSLEVSVKVFTLTVLTLYIQIKIKKSDIIKLIIGAIQSNLYH